MWALIGDEMLGRLAGGGAGALKKGQDVGGGGFRREDREGDEPAGKMIEDESNPIGKGEDLGESEREPGHPETGGRDDGQVGVPHMVGIAGND